MDSHPQDEGCTAPSCLGRSREQARASPAPRGEAGILGLYGGGGGEVRMPSPRAMPRLGPWISEGEQREPKR